MLRATILYNTVGSCAITTIYHDLNHDLNHDGTHTAHCGGKLVVGEVGEVGKGWKEVPVYPRIVGEYPIKPPI